MGRVSTPRPHRDRESGPDPSLQFLQLLWALDHALQQRSKSMSAEMGITGPQRFVLRFVDRSPGASAGEIAELLRLHPSTLTGILRRMEERGVLERKIDPVDKRRARLYVTPRGAEFVRAGRGTVEADVKRTLEACSKREIDITTRVLKQLTSALTKPE